MVFFPDDDKPVKRTLGIRDKQILYERAKGRCENPACGKKITFVEMQPGHMTAFSRGGATTLKNSKCLCYRCNKLQGTDSWATFLKKQNLQDPEAAKKRAEATKRQAMKQKLETLTVSQLKSLSDGHHIKVLGRIEEGLFEDRRLAPTKSQYVSNLLGVVTDKELNSLAKETPNKAKTEKPRR